MEGLDKEPSGSTTPSPPQPEKALSSPLSLSTVKEPTSLTKPSSIAELSKLPPPPSQIPTNTTQPSISSSPHSQISPKTTEYLSLPPPPPLIPPGVVPDKLKIEAPMECFKIMSRPQFGKSGGVVPLLTNFFRVSFPTNADVMAYQYDVSIKPKGRESSRGLPKDLLRSIMEKVKQLYSHELGNKHFAYDGEKSLYTIGSLANNHIEFEVVIDRRSQRHDNTQEQKSKKMREDRTGKGESFIVSIKWASKISMRELSVAAKGCDSVKMQDALRVLDIALRENAVQRNYLLVRQSFFHTTFAPPLDLGGAVQGCRGYHSSFRPTLGGLTLNMDVSTTMLIKAGPVLDVLMRDQRVNNEMDINWSRAKSILKGVKVRTMHTGVESKINDISVAPCDKLSFSLKTRGSDGADPSFEDLTIAEYFRRRWNIVRFPNLPCLDLGSKKHPNYVPVELCEILPLQRYTKSLSVYQRASLAEQSRQKPGTRMEVLTKAMDLNSYNDDKLLKSCKVSVDKNLVPLKGRVLSPPMLLFGNNKLEQPRNGRWNFTDKGLFEPVKVPVWALVNFSRRTKAEVENMARQMHSTFSRRFGVEFEPCQAIVGEYPPPPYGTSPSERVNRMFDRLKSQLGAKPTIVVCILQERKSSDVYGPWKKKCLSDLGIPTQCIAPSKVNDQYWTNVALKINAKIGGLNIVLQIERMRKLPVISEHPTIIIGMDVSHGMTSHADATSIAAVVSSVEWPKISKYRAETRTQSRKTEMIESLYKCNLDGKDEGMIRNLLVEFYQSSGKRKPDKMIIFRDGVSESQFDQVLNIELSSVVKACFHLEEDYRPSITLIIAQKNHHAKLFPANGRNENVPPGTIVDTQICHARNFDFYLVPQNGPIGTSRPTHYHVLVDENNFKVDDLQNTIHALSYVYQRSTSAISSVAPINYAHLAASQMQQFLKADDRSSESGSSIGRGSRSSHRGMPQLPKLHPKVSASMFFC
uniref:Argonaute 4 n=1 Tax=Ephedra trifurca TaxID=39583 RepID=A0A0C4W3T8_9SPER|nr:Argonaute 4 [Ephedra trifurca]